MVRAIYNETHDGPRAGGPLPRTAAEVLVASAAHMPLLLGPLLLAMNHGHRDMYPGERPKPSIVQSPLPHTYMNMSALPRTYDIRNLNGKSLATDNRNQHIPQYVGTSANASLPQPSR